MGEAVFSASLSCRSSCQQQATLLHFTFSACLSPENSTSFSPKLFLLYQRKTGNSNSMSLRDPPATLPYSLTSASQQTSHEALNRFFGAAAASPVPFSIQGPKLSLFNRAGQRTAQRDVTTTAFPGAPFISDTDLPARNLLDTEHPPDTLSKTKQDYTFSPQAQAPVAAESRTSETAGPLCKHQ